MSDIIIIIIIIIKLPNQAIASAEMTCSIVDLRDPLAQQVVQKM
jgi:hypothetical protein